MKKRILSILLVLVITVVFLPTFSNTANAESTNANVVNQIHIHFPNGITDIPIPKLGEPVWGSPIRK